MSDTRDAMALVSSQIMEAADLTVEKFVGDGASRRNAQAVVLAALVDVVVKIAHRDALDHDLVVLTVKEHLRCGPGFPADAYVNPAAN